MKVHLIAYDVSQKDQAEELHTYITEYYSTSPWLPSMEKIMQGGVNYFKAMHNNQQIGITGYVLKTPTLAETVKTTVFHDFRSKGFGKLISEAIEDECRRIGVKKIMTTIFHFNHSMVAIKLKQGYTIEGYHPDHEAPGFHEYSLGKVLK